MLTGVLGGLVYHNRCQTPQDRDSAWFGAERDPGVVTHSRLVPVVVILLVNRECEKVPAARLPTASGSEGAADWSSQAHIRAVTGRANEIANRSVFILSPRVIASFR